MSLIDELCRWVNRILMLCWLLLVLNINEIVFYRKERSLSMLFHPADGPTYASNFTRQNVSNNHRHVPVANRTGLNVV